MRKRRRSSPSSWKGDNERSILIGWIVFTLSVSSGSAWMTETIPKLTTNNHGTAYYLAGGRQCRTALCASKRRDSHKRERAHIPRPDYRLGGQAYLGPPKEQAKPDLVSNERDAEAPEDPSTDYSSSEFDSVAARPSVAIEMAHSGYDKVMDESALPMNETRTEMDAIPARATAVAVSPNRFFSTWPITSVSHSTNTTKSAEKSFPIVKRKKDTSKSKAVEATFVPEKDQDKLITFRDLERILAANGYVRKWDLDAEQSSREKPSSAVHLGISTSIPVTTQRTKSGVALPQLSVLSYRDLSVGCTLAAGIFGMLLSSTVLPNLWLVGAFCGGIYGYDLSKKAQDTQPTFVFNNLIVQAGRKLAKSYLFVYDALNGVWFMYRTGQLSYSYYKQYARLDQRFGIGDTMDAWNARFQEGKANFDRWERENEVGRRVLAGMRTAWLVGEKRRGKRKSRYRVVQAFYDVTGWLRRFIAASWNSATGGGGSEMREVMRGIRIDVSESRMNEIGPRIGAATMALVTIYMVGALYSLSARLLGFLAVLTGLVWPTWVIELGDRFRLLFRELRARGRGEELLLLENDKYRQVPSTRLQPARYDRNRYHYFTRTDGSKRWYRTGRPAFRSEKPIETQGPWWSTGSDRFKRSLKSSDNKDGQQKRWSLFSGNINE